MTQTEALRLALEALEEITRRNQSDHQAEIAEEAITAIKVAPEAPQRTWVGLTDEDKQDWIKCMPWPPEPAHLMVLIDGIESELKDLNR